MTTRRPAPRARPATLPVNGGVAGRVMTSRPAATAEILPAEI
ncbi:hypothetical protein [Rhodococcus yananensis]|nr:hypothetical protein [Rhodococcus yananensis]